MGEAGADMCEIRSTSSDGCSRWTGICEPNLNLDPEVASLNKKHLDHVTEYDSFLVSLGRKIAEGGQGKVFTAKLYVPYSFKPVPLVVKKFKKFEGVSQGHFPIELVNSLKSYNVCLPFGYFYDGDSLCLMMRGYSCDLRGAIDSRMEALGADLLGTNASPFSEFGGNSIILQVAMALKVLHENGIYHRDLKADNILILARGKNYDTSPTAPLHVALADFERSEGVVGTAFFRAPEVLRSLRTRVPLSEEEWRMADVFSFGMVCYEVLTGKYPFEGHLQSDYDLMLNGGRPELPMHLSPTWRDLILRCWHEDPQSRPGWDEIIAAALQGVALDFGGDLVRKLPKLESLSLESLIDEAKHVIRREVLLHERDAERFRTEFMSFYWVSEFVATAEKCASKFGKGSLGGGSPPVCGFLETFERVKLHILLSHQMFGFQFDNLAVSNLYWEEDRTPVGLTLERVTLRNDLLFMVMVIHRHLYERLANVDFGSDFEVGTSWIAKLSFYYALTKWALWYEHADSGLLGDLITRVALPTQYTWDQLFQLYLFLFCMFGNGFAYVLAMITYEPLLLGVQYGLYKTMGSKNILYRSFGERICRFQRAWMNSTRLWTKQKGVSIILCFSFIILCGVYGWKGILGWILLPGLMVNTLHWRRCVRTVLKDSLY